MRGCRRTFIWLLTLLAAGVAHAAPVASDYQASIQLAAQGQDANAIQRLREVMQAVARGDPWQARLGAAANLIEARSKLSTRVELDGAPIQKTLADAYIKANPAPGEAGTLAVGVLSLLMPGGGHAWLGRWRDAGVAALMVWPMIGLTLWAARRRMGPVTVFFALITIWLWSGVIFSALSMAEREAAEAYMQWWQGLWGATGLPGRPW